MPTTQTYTDSLIERITRHEGLRLKPYLDTEGKLTIGYGRNLTDVGISEVEAVSLLIHDIATAQAAVNRGWPWLADRPKVVKGVVVEMVFQMGLAGVIGFTGMLGHLENGNYPAAADAMLDSLWAKQTPARAQELAGLVRGAMVSP